MNNRHVGKIFPLIAKIITICGLVIVVILSTRHFGYYRDEPRTQRISCVNNLKQIGLAFRIWGGDNGDQYPFNVSTNAGGTMELCAPDKDSFDSNVALHLRVMSNELSTPLILICPEENSKKGADTFANLTPGNVTYKLHTGTNVTAANPNVILMVCPVDGNILHCDGTVSGKNIPPADPNAMKVK